VKLLDGEWLGRYRHDNSFARSKALHRDDEHRQGGMRSPCLAGSWSSDGIHHGVSNSPLTPAIGNEGEYEIICDVCDEGSSADLGYGGEETCSGFIAPGHRGQRTATLIWSFGSSYDFVRHQLRYSYQLQSRRVDAELAGDPRPIRVL